MVIATVVATCPDPVAAAGSIALIDWTMRGETETVVAPPIRVDLARQPARLPRPLLLDAETGTILALEAATGSARRPDGVLEGMPFVGLDPFSGGPDRAWIFPSPAGTGLPADALYLLITGEPRPRDLDVIARGHGASEIAAVRWNRYLLRGGRPPETDDPSIRYLLAVDRVIDLTGDRAGLLEAAQSARRAAEAAGAPAETLRRLDYIRILARLNASILTGRSRDDWRSAVAEAERALAGLDAADPAVLADRGRLRFLLGDLRGAYADLDVSARAAPDVDSLLDLAQVAAAAGRPGRARTALSAAEIRARSATPPGRRDALLREVQAVRLRLGL